MNLFYFEWRMHFSDILEKADKNYKYNTLYLR